MIEFFKETVIIIFLKWNKINGQNGRRMIDTCLIRVNKVLLHAVCLKIEMDSIYIV